MKKITFAILTMTPGIIKHSPDTKRIAFISGKFPGANIFIANADGTNQVKITNQ